MKTVPRVVIVCMGLLAPSCMQAQEPILAPGDGTPILRLDLRGPASRVLSLAMSRDGSTLYAGGDDKVIHAWRLRDNRYDFDPAAVIRIPIGGGQVGVINSIAVSDGGRWVAVGGRGRVRSASDALRTGWIWPSTGLSEAARRDLGMIYVFDLLTREVHLLSGHQQMVDFLTFVPGSGDDAPVLVSVSADYPAAASPAADLRIWDVSKNQLMKRLSLRQFKIKPQTKLIAWKTGPRQRDVQVAFLCKKVTGRRSWDWRLGVYDLAHNQLSPNAEQFPMMDETRAIALLPSAENAPRLLSFGFENSKGRSDARILRVPVTGDGRLGVLSPSHYQPIQSQVANSPQKIPEAVALFSSQPGAAPDHAAVVVTDYQAFNTNQQTSTELVLLSLNDWRIVGQRIPLWNSRAAAPTQPSISSAAGSRFIAVGESPQHEILAFSIRDLLSGVQPQPQRLRSSGLTAQAVAFVKQNDVLGLRITPTNGEPIIVDPARRRVATNDGTWSESRIAAGQWELTQPAPNDVTLEYQGARRSLETEAGETPTAAAVCPATEFCPVPLAAVGLQKSGEARLALFNAQNGRELRWLSGHTGLIKSLSFSGDGRYLVSAADDSTVRVWSIADLQRKNLGKHGLIRGLEVGIENGNLVVKKPPAGGLEVGDQIDVAVEPDGKNRAFDSAWDFYAYVVGKKPGETVQLNVTRAGRQLAVNLPVDQAIDESKALVSLFLAEQQPGQFSWIGWNPPSGRYDASSRDFEANLGWHINTGDPREPAQFFSVNQYRARNYQKDLIETLLQDGELKHKPAPPAPQMSLQVLPTDQGDDSPLRALAQIDALEFTTDQLQASLLFTDEFPLDFVESVQLSLNGGNPISMDRRSDAEREWQIQLPAAQLRRGRQANLMEVVVRTNEADARRFEQQIEFRYQRPNPQIESNQEVTRTVNAPRQTIAANVTSPGEAISVDVFHRHQGKVVAEKKLESREGKLNVEMEVELQEGNNEILIVAANSAAKDVERSVRPFFLRYEPPAVDPPVINVESILPVGGSDAAALKPNPAQPTVVAASRIRLRGIVTSKARLDAATFGLSKGTDPEKLTPLAAVPERNVKLVSPRKIEFTTEPIELTPGSQFISVSAKTRDGVSDSKVLRLDYRPQLPQLKLRVKGFDVDPERPFDQIVIYEGKAGAGQKISATAEIDNDWPPGKFTVQFVRSVGGERQVIPAVIDREQKTASADVELLAARNNRIQVELTTDYGSSAKSDELHLLLLQTPQITASKLNADNRQGKFSPRCTVRSRMKPRDFIVRVKSKDGQVHVYHSRSKKYRFSVEQDPNDPQLWHWQARDLPFSVGENQVTFEVKNDDGSSTSRSDHGAKLQYGVKFDGKDIPVEISFVEVPNGPLLSSSGRVRIQFSVSSPRPLGSVVLHKIELDRNGEKLPSPVGEELKFPAGTTRQTFAPQVAINPGDPGVYLEVVATNEAGIPQRVALPEPVFVLAPPLKPVLTRIVHQSNPKEVLFERSTDGSAAPRQIRPATDSLVTISGILTKPESEESWNYYEYANVTTKVWVNGFLQDSARVIFDKSRQSPPQFEMKNVVLNLPKNNEIYVEVVGDNVATEQRSLMQRHVMDCTNPDRRQTLHMLAINDGSQETNDGEQVTDERVVQQMQEALDAKLTDRNGLKTLNSDAFPSILPVPRLPIGNRSTLKRIDTALAKLRFMLDLSRKRRAERKQGNDVILVYYKGWEVVTPDNESVLLTKDNNDPERLKTGHSALTNVYLSNNLRDIGGAHLLILDARLINRSRSNYNSVNNWVKDAQLGVLRLAVTNPQQQFANHQPLISMLRIPNESEIAQISTGIKALLAQNPNLTFSSSYEASVLPQNDTARTPLYGAQ